MRKLYIVVSQAVTSLTIAVALAGCAGTGADSAHHPGPGHSGAQGGGMMGGGMMGGGTAGPTAATGTPPALTPMDREAMCAEYHQIQNAPTDQQRQAIIEQHMQGMSPEMRAHHLDMMRQQCRHQ